MCEFSSSGSYFTLCFFSFVLGILLQYNMSLCRTVRTVLTLFRMCKGLLLHRSIKSIELDFSQLGFEPCFVHLAGTGLGPCLHGWIGVLGFNRAVTWLSLMGVAMVLVSEV